MCVYHYEDSRRADCWIKILLLGCLGFSAAVSIPMFILTYPGDECLLFVSVRGEALIYGNPAGCNFIAYGHGIIGLIAIITLGLLLFRRKKGIIRRKQPKEIDSTRSLRGTQLSGQNGIGLGQSHYNFQSEDRLSHFGISRFYSTKVLVLSAITSTFALVTAMVIMSGYLITCNELHYETRRQVLGKTTLGSPIKSLNIQCWSLFRDTDFHTRFHFDHYEFSGQWHGQYRGYQHGREHQYRNSHEHLIEVALALELSLSSTWFSAALWITVTCLMVILKKRQKQLQARELAESIEDAKIFASSRQLDPSQNIMMQPISDQLSVTSNQSSVLSQKPSIMSGNSVSTQPMGGSAIVQNHNGIPMVVQQQMLSQQEILNQQMLQMQQLQTQMANQQRLHQSQPTLVAGGAQITQHDQRPASQQIIRPIQVPVSQQQQMAQQNQLAQLQQQAQQNQQYQQQAAQQTQLQQLQQQQQYMTQQNGVQYVQLYNGVVMPVVTQPQQTQPVIQQQTQQQAPAVVVSPPQHQQKPNGLAHHGSNSVNSPPKSIVSSNKHDYSSIEEIDGRKNKSKTAQKLQLDLSQDAGLKCSQI